MSCDCNKPPVPPSLQQLRSIALASSPVTPKCPPGYHWDDAQQKCVVNPPPPPPIPSWNCVPGLGCVDPGDGSGHYKTYAACVAGCPPPPPPLCYPSPTILIDPPDGSTVQFPCYVFLKVSNRSDAPIYYTLDGSTPTDQSTVYSGPFKLDSNAQIRAIAKVPTCPYGAESDATYTSTTKLLFEFIQCANIDRAGTFTGPSSGFAPDTSTDYSFRIKFTTVGAFTVKRIEIYNIISSSGVWTTGQAWATNSPISPPEGPANFAVFPLVLTMDAPAWITVNTAFSLAYQPFTSYQASLGAINIGDHFWQAFGQPASGVPNYGYFKLRLIDSGNNIITSIIPTGTVGGGGTSGRLKIAGYTNGLFTTPTPALGNVIMTQPYFATGPYADWGGVFIQDTATSWNRGSFYANNPNPNYASINGYDLYGGSLELVKGDSNNSFGQSLNGYRILVAFAEGASTDYSSGVAAVDASWTGTKLCSDSPVGRYYVTADSPNPTPIYVDIILG